MLRAKRNVEKHDHNIATSEFMTKLNEIITMANDSSAYESSSFTKNLHNRGPRESLGTTAQKMVFSNYQTLTNDTLMLFADAVLDVKDVHRITGGHPLPDASTLIFEVSTDDKVAAFLNDNQALIQGCSSMADCSVAEVSASLAGKIVYTDLATTCAN